MNRKSLRCGRREGSAERRISKAGEFIPQIQDQIAVTISDELALYGLHWLELDRTCTIFVWWSYGREAGTRSKQNRLEG